MKDIGLLTKDKKEISCEVLVLGSLITFYRVTEDAHYLVLNGVISTAKELPQKGEGQNIVIRTGN